MIADSIPSPDAVVVGHSFAGILLRLVARLRRCGSLVFLAAAIPEPGKSLEDQLRADPSMLSAAWLAAGPRWREASQRRQVADEFLFHDCDPETRAWALGTLDHLDTGPLVSEALPSEAGPTRPVASIVATDDRTLSPAWSRRITREVLGVEPFEIRSGHCPHVSRPGAVAEMLHDWAARAASPGRPP